MALPGFQIIVGSNDVAVQGVSLDRQVANQRQLPAGAQRESLARMYAVAALLVFSGAGLPLLARPGGVGAVQVDADALSSASRAVIYGVFLLVATGFASELRVAAAPAKLVIAVSVLAVLSSAWSVDRAVTIRSGLLLLATTAFGLYFGMRFTRRAQLELTGWTMAWVILLSFCFVVFTPLGIQPGDYDGAWRGAFQHKNLLGRAAALGLPVFWLLAMQATRWQLVTWILASMCAALVVLSKSAGSLLVAAATVGVIMALPALRTRRLRGFALAAVAILAALVVALVVANVEVVLKLLGRDPTLTGRTALWALVIPKILAKPWLGYGLDAFWHGHQVLYADIWRIVGWQPPHAHNGFLNVALDLGIVGVTVFAAGCFPALWRAFRAFRSLQPTPPNAWPLVYLIFFLLANLTEVTFLQYSNLFWVLYVASAVSTNEPEPVRIR